MPQDSAKPTAHSRHVAALCERLFAPTGHLHGLTKPSLRLLKRAALVHDLGASKTIRRCTDIPIQSGELFHQALADLAADERRLVAHALAAFHLGRQVDTQRAAVAPGRERAALEIAWRLGALLRVADALDRSRTQDVEVLAVVDDGTAIEILVSGGRTAAADARADWSADLWETVALRPIRAIRVAEQGADVPGSVAPGDAMADAARRLLRAQFEQFAAREHGLAYEHDIEYVHEMRVALRRFLAVLRVTRRSLDLDYAAVRDAVAWLVDALGVVRDLDVYVAFLRRYAREAPDGHSPVLRRLIRSEQGKRRRGYLALLDIFRSERVAAVRRSLQALLIAPTPPEHPAPTADRGEGKTVAGCASRTLRRRLKRVMDYGKRLDLLPAEEQHALRIACKWLRYTAEIFGPVYKGRLAEIVGPMVKLQDALGDVHDADVYRERIAQYASRPGRGSGAAGALDALLGHLGEWRGSALCDASSVWRQFRSRKTQHRLKMIIDSATDS